MIYWKLEKRGRSPGGDGMTGSPIFTIRDSALIGVIKTRNFGRAFEGRRFGINSKEAVVVNVISMQILLPPV